MFDSQVPELENMLFNTKFRVEQGDSMDKLNVYDVLVEGPKQVKLVHSFQDAGLHPNMMKIIDLIGYKKPTPIQQYTIPAVNQGQDLIAIAQTGEMCVPPHFTLTDHLLRLWQDCCLSYPHRIASDRQSEEVGRPST